MKRDYVVYIALVSGCFLGFVFVFLFFFLRQKTLKCQPNDSGFITVYVDKLPVLVL